MNTNSEQAGNEALQAIRSRFYSGRHPELGKMIKCQVCGRRHREHEITCKQKFVKIENIEQIAGQTPATKPDPFNNGLKAIIGASSFNRRRHNSHANRWAETRENTRLKKELEQKKRLAKPLNIWPNDRSFNGPASTNSSQELPKTSEVPSTDS